jgi:hypothetical protein
MMMSLLRQRAATRQLDHLACVDLAVDAEASKMIAHAFIHRAAVLVGLAEGEAIIKPAEPDDDRLSFEGLYDTAISIREFRRMAATKVKSPKDLPPSLYEAAILLTEINFAPTVVVRFPAKGAVGAREALRQLVNTPEFREQMIRRFITQIIDHPVTELVTKGCVQVDEVAPPDLTWELQDLD